VHVALDRAHQEFAHSLHAGVGEQRAQHLHRTRHRAPGDQHLRDEEVAALEPGAHLLQRRDQRVEEEALRLHLQTERLVGELQDPRGVAEQGFVVEAFENVLRCHVTPSAWCRDGAAPTARPPVL
jgi:hypothetical protein